MSNASQHVPVYLQPFTSYSEILVGNCNFFVPLAFNAPFGGDPLERSSSFLVGEFTELSDGQTTIWCKNIQEKYTPRVGCTHVTDDRQTDRFATAYS